MDSSMTIHLMENAPDGDKRIKNELSRNVDITPCKFITRKAWIETIVKDMILTGNSVHIPHYERNVLDDIEPVARSKYSILDRDYGFSLLIRGQPFEHDEVLHFILTPTRAPVAGAGARGLAQKRRKATHARKEYRRRAHGKPGTVDHREGGRTDGGVLVPEGRRKLSEQS
jgi:hypothetical protein